MLKKISILLFFPFAANASMIDCNMYDYECIKEKQIHQTITPKDDDHLSDLQKKRSIVVEKPKGIDELLKLNSNLPKQGLISNDKN